MGDEDDGQVQVLLQAFRVDVELIAPLLYLCNQIGIGTFFHADALHRALREDNVYDATGGQPCEARQRVVGVRGGSRFRAFVLHNVFLCTAS